MVLELGLEVRVRCGTRDYLTDKLRREYAQERMDKTDKARQEKTTARQDKTRQDKTRPRRQDVTGGNETRRDEGGEKEVVVGLNVGRRRKEG